MISSVGYEFVIYDLYLFSVLVFCLRMCYARLALSLYLCLCVLHLYFVLYGSFVLECAILVLSLSLS